ncbi:hypothetical protein AVEN_93954-1 [Araneus ventricosus]|uniref:Uncharacterized protein n=1 Tax=Araneus ventricosus TaxID=182803 RepID=A0A4Y2CJE9_ARAVE|nr:hypothetical protein AVEN_93954-1 [Araneus ventricosus]
MLASYSKSMFAQYAQFNIVETDIKIASVGLFALIKHSPLGDMRMEHGSKLTRCQTRTHILTQISGPYSLPKKSPGIPMGSKIHGGTLYIDSLMEISKPRVHFA